MMLRVFIDTEILEYFKMHVYIIKMSYYIEKYKFKEIFIKDYTLELTLARIS